MDNEPPIPHVNEQGRLAFLIPSAAQRLIAKGIPLLKPGWHCRMCRDGLCQVYNPVTSQLQPYVACTRCDGVPDGGFIFS